MPREGTHRLAFAALIAVAALAGPAAGADAPRAARLLPPTADTPDSHTAFSPPLGYDVPPGMVEGLPVHPAVPLVEQPPACPVQGPSAEPGRCGPFDFVTAGGGRWSGFPGTLLWYPPLAIKREPRTQALLTSLSNPWTEETVDTSIGLDAGLIRYEPPGRRFAVQLDGFAAVLSRFLKWNYEVVADYRAGLPVTIACGPWHGKIGYEHTSSHLGDDTIELTGRETILFVRDELVGGLGRWMFDNRLRAYGQAAWMFHGTVQGSSSQFRFDVGLEAYWRFATKCWGAPFAAVNLDLDGVVDYSPAVNVQIGWAWRDPSRRLSNARVYGEYYTGHSPYGQFYQTRESFFGFGLSIDY